MKIYNGQPVGLADIEQLSYDAFYSDVNSLMNSQAAHCVNYFAVPYSTNQLQLFCCIANDEEHNIDLLTTIVPINANLRSLTAQHLAFHPFERDIHERYGINFEDHPWLKPLRFPHNRANNGSIYDYPFFNIQSEEFHRVGVGPIHAGIIEPGHFRFICEGEKIHHLEIQLGWQHRGWEETFLQKKGLLQRATLAEQIAGDTVVGHSVAFAQAFEALSGIEPSEQLVIERTIALEHERIAVHTGDLSAICTDIAYQLGNAVFGRLRTPMINYFQKWCGSRFAKGLIRPGKSNFPLTQSLADEWKQTVEKYRPHFIEMAEEMFDLPSVLSRIERTGVVSTNTAQNIGLVGMAAKASGLSRDVRTSHPYASYAKLGIEPVLKTSGDVYARARVRYEEVLASISYIENLLEIATLPTSGQYQYQPVPNANLKPSSFIASLTEGWRGEICHCALTNAQGEITAYKVADPSVHNWLGLAMAVRNNGISDFPICNKSFDLSYCGHDL